jgi:hypothetical protein
MAPAYILELREALRLAGDTCVAAKQIADDALARWPKLDAFK